MRGVVVGSIALVVLALTGSPARAWTPEGAQYGVGASQATVTASDGTKLHATVAFPTDAKTGKAADGPFPVLLSQTPYVASVSSSGQDAGPAAAGATASTGNNPYLVKRGYIAVTIDVRGTGGSEGQWGLFDPEQATDGATAAKWAAKLPHSTGEVGLVGGSYLGITQFGAAVQAGPNSPIKAMFPVISSNELYRDEVSAGGFPSAEFNLPYLLAVSGGLNVAGPAASPDASTATVLADHLGGTFTKTLPTLQNILSGGDEAYDGPYWQSRSPVNTLQQIAKLDIPVFLVGGWFDLFQRGEPLNYSGLQNAYAGRDVLAPMPADAKPTGRVQLLQGPWYHVTVGSGAEWHGLSLDELMLSWFDRWLKGVPTGIDQTDTPLHAYDLGTDKWVDAKDYPLERNTPTTYYLGDGGSLSPAKPPAGAQSDTLPWTGASASCATSIEQWAAGGGQLALGLAGLSDPCTKDASISQAGPGVKNFQTAPMAKDTTLAGPIAARLYATSTTKDAEWVVTVSDVAPDGSSRSLTAGLLSGALRAEDAGHTWTAADGNPILPYHPYTPQSSQPIPAGQVTRFDVEVFPTFATIKAGHRLRISIATGDEPHVVPSSTQLPNLLGGQYVLQRNAQGPSSVELPLAPGGTYADTPTGPLPVAATAPKAACLSRRSFVVHPVSKGRLRSVRVTVAGHRARLHRVGRRGVRVTLAGLPKRPVTVRLTGRLAGGRRFSATRRYMTCTRRR